MGTIETLTVGAAVVGALASAAGAWASLRSARASSEAAERATRALAMHSRVRMLVEAHELDGLARLSNPDLVDQGALVVFQQQTLDGAEHTPLSDWKLEYSTTSGQTGRMNNPVEGRFRLPGVKYGEIAGMTLRVRDPATGHIWTTTAKGPPMWEPRLMDLE